MPWHHTEYAGALGLAVLTLGDQIILSYRHSPCSGVFKDLKVDVDEPPVIKHRPSSLFVTVRFGSSIIKLMVVKCHPFSHSHRYIRHCGSDPGSALTTSKLWRLTSHKSQLTTNMPYFCNNKKGKWWWRLHCKLEQDPRSAYPAHVNREPGLEPDYRVLHRAGLSPFYHTAFLRRCFQPSLKGPRYYRAYRRQSIT